MPELHLKQPWYFTDFLFFTNRGRIQKFRETSLKHLHRNELDRACFTHDAACSDSKDLNKTTR